MTGLDLEKLIPSRDVRKQCIRENRIFDLREQATLAWNNDALDYRERLESLRNILEIIKNDLSYRDLFRQIKERIDIQFEMEKRFYDNETNQYYGIAYKDIDGGNTVNEDILFSDIQKAQEHAERETMGFCLGGKYQIAKGYLNSSDRITACFCIKGGLVCLHDISSSFDSHDNSRFEDAFVPVPHPFREGDFVRTIGRREIGIFRGCRDEDAYRRRLDFQKEIKDKGIADYTDISCTAEYLEPYCHGKKCFSHRHPSLLTLEFAGISDDDEDSRLMKAAQDIVRGEGSLDMLSVLILNDR